MSVIEKSIEVAVPVRVAYDQWTQFEEFPEFMEGVEEIEQLDDTTMRWHVNIAGNDRTFTAEVVEQEPDEKVAWRSTESEDHSGVVTFTPVDSETTRVDVEMDYNPQTWTEKVADSLNILDLRVQRDLERFKSFIEERGTETGAWRGEVKGGEASTETSTEQPLTGGMPGGSDQGTSGMGDDPLRPGGEGTHR